MLIQAKKKDTVVSFSFLYCDYRFFTHCHCCGQGQNCFVEAACKTDWLCKFVCLTVLGSVCSPVKDLIQL